ncbi:MAG: ABC transporter permease [Lachnospiraceae bacterium]|nr:ABC transporter permease [Lachnospiraceae bacterium]
MKNKGATPAKTIIFTLAFPLAAWIVMELLVYLTQGRHVISTLLDIKTLVRNSGVAAITAFALSFNLTSGRMDLSLGAQRLAGCIIGGALAIELGLSGVFILLFSLAFGLVFGFLTGLMFITMRVPAMVLGIGMGLIWEVFPYQYTKGKGLNLFGVEGVAILSDTAFIIILTIVVGAFVTVLMNSTRFGYQLRAIQGSQLISQNSGINIFRHTILCYTFAGGLVCIAGIMDTAFNTQLAASLGLASNGPVTSNMFPMILGGYIGRKSNQAVGTIVAAIAINIIRYGLVQLNLSEANASVVNMVLFVGFLIFLANEHVLKKRQAERERIAAAHAKMQTAEAA